MKLVKFVAFLGLLAMTGILTYAFIKGDFSSEGSKLLSMPWGIVSLVDLYTGFSLFSMWIIYREKSLLRALVWIFFMMTLGFFTGSVYTLLAIYTSQGNWERFWKGTRFSGIQ